MCGLAGVMVGPQKGDQEIARYLLKDLLERIEHRGRHATGVGVYAEGDRPGRIWKVAETASKVLKSKSFNDFILDLPEKSRIFVGHTRQATHGHHEKNENAHPFQKGRVIGAHNGIIWNYKDLAEKYKVPVPQVDSEIAFTLLDKFKDPTTPMPDFGGYFALTWFKHGKLYMAKSDGAELAFAYVPTLHMLVWASTGTVLNAALEAAGFKQDEYKWFKPDDDTIYQFDFNKFDDKSTNRVAIKCEFQKRQRTFYGGPQRVTQTITRPYRNERWDWEEYYGLKDERQPTLWEDRRSSTTSKETAVVKVVGATTGKEVDPPTKKSPGLPTWKELSDMVEVLVRDRNKAIKALQKMWDDNRALNERLEELERQMDMVHETFGLSDAMSGITEDSVCVYCHRGFSDALEIADGAILPEGPAHYQCLFGHAGPTERKTETDGEAIIVVESSTK